MKKKYVLLLSLFIPLLCAPKARQTVKNKRRVPDSAFTIDTIQAIVFGQGGTQVIARSDVVRPSLTGVPQSLDDIIFERLVFLDAQKYKIVPDEDAVDKYLAIVQKENNLTLDQLKDIFASAGYTYEEGRQQFRVLQTVNSMLGLKIHSQVIVPRAQVEEYYKTHPEIKEAEYHLQYGFVPHIPEKRVLQEKALRVMVKTGKEMRGMQWQDPFWVKQSEIADDKVFLFSLKVGGVSKPRDRGDGYELYRLLDKHEEHIPTLDERYHEIAAILRRPVFEELMQKYKKSLFDSVSILNFN